MLVEREVNKAIRNIPDGWIQIADTDTVQEGDMLWTCGINRFELEDSRSPHLGDPVNDKLCAIRKEEKEIKVRFKSLKKVLKENPELILTEWGTLGTQQQIDRRDGQWTLNHIWTTKLGEDFVCQIPSMIENLERFIEREYDDTHMLTWDRIEKTKESWKTVRDLLNDEDHKGAGIQLELLRDHIAIIVSKLHDYDRKAVNINKGIETRDKLLEKKNHEIDSLQCELNISRSGYETTIKDLRTQLGSIESNSKETIMKRKFTRIIKT